MCDYLKRMEKINVPTEEIRLWSGLAHRVVDYTSPFPIPEDVVVMLWLHEESAVRLLDMCDDIDEKFSELETENAKLRELVNLYHYGATHEASPSDVLAWSTKVDSLRRELGIKED